MINEVFRKMTEYYFGDPKRIQHFTKVYAYAGLIGKLEGLNQKELCILETAALVHDIGIKEAEATYNSCAGKYQEELGPGIANELLKQAGYDDSIIERVCFLVGHHHTYSGIDGADYQILVEADFIVNMYEEGCGRREILSVYNKIFKTESGKRIYANMFGIES